MLSRAPENACEKSKSSSLTQRTSPGEVCSKQLVLSCDMDHLMQNLVAEGLLDVLPTLS